MENKHKDNNTGYNPFFKYSGIGLQLLITIAIGVWLGTQIDDYMQNKQPWAAILFALIFIIVGLVVFIRSLPKL